MPKFSVIIPTYNRVFCIKRAIDSVLFQYYKNFEIIIIDDGSTDNTEQFINETYKNEIENQLIRYFKIEHHGASKARNTALKNAKNEWITYLDSDDEYDVNFLKTVSKCIIQNPAYKNFYCKTLMYTNKNTKIQGKKFNYNDFYKKCYIGTSQYIHHISLINEI
jgi:glycosyltransferase involved in cell wall biosynthesis